jgi:replication factor A1
MAIEDIVDEISKQSKVSKDEIFSLVDKKYEELSGLVTKEGAAYLVAKDLGVYLKDFAIRGLQIKNILHGMKNINVIGRVFKISPINEFKRNGKVGKVVNIFIADHSGYVKVPLWNDQVKIVEEGLLKVGDIVQITGGFVKENVFGDLEISFGRFGAIKTVEDFVDLPTVDELNKKYFSNIPERVPIKSLVVGNFEISGIIVKVFKGKFLFESEGEKNMVISCILDDGTSNIRCVFFRELAEEICGIRTKDLEKLSEDERFEKINEKIRGLQLIVSGKVKKNISSNALEMIADSVKTLNPLDESKKIVSLLELKIGE